MKSNEKFTQLAELAIENARAAAGELGHSYVGTEHLLLGIITEDAGLGARVLRGRGIDENRLRRAIADWDGTGAPGVPVQGLSLRGTGRRGAGSLRGRGTAPGLYRHRASSAGHPAPKRLWRGRCSAGAGCRLKRPLHRYSRPFRQSLLQRPPQTGTARSTVRGLRPGCWTSTAGI